MASCRRETLTFVLSVQALEGRHGQQRVSPPNESERYFQRFLVLLAIRKHDKVCDDVFLAAKMIRIMLSSWLSDCEEDDNEFNHSTGEQGLESNSRSQTNRMKKMCEYPPTSFRREMHECISAFEPDTRGSQKQCPEREFDWT